MDVQRLASFTEGPQGGNAAGVVLCDCLPSAATMQATAAEVGYSETVFAAPVEGGFRTRYFAPEAEVPFCGHATIALGAALGAAHGAGAYALQLNGAKISVEAYHAGDLWGARLTSPNTRFEAVQADVLAQALSLFGWDRHVLDPAIPPALINGGAQHVLIALRTHETLQAMTYDFDKGAALMRAQDWVTINLIWRESDALIWSRNPFAGHGVYEDPATGAAAAALAGYLRDAGLQAGPFAVRQGGEMGHPSRLHVTPSPGQGAPIEVAGTVRPIG